jgi:hypothetical protein
MLKKSVSLLLIFSLSLWTAAGCMSTYPSAKDSEAEKGAEVVIVERDGQEIAGELLSVRDSSIVISTIEKAKGYLLAGDTAGVVVVSSEKIQKVIIKVESKVLTGMGLGFLIGGVIGGVIGHLSFAKPKDGWGLVDLASLLAALSYLTLGGLCGLAVGAILGSAASSDKEVEPIPNHDFSSLKPFARFPVNEPEW